jgi:hypothetical protein
MKSIYLERTKSLKEIINNIGVGLYSTKIDDVNDVYITSEKYPDIIIKPVEVDIPKPVLIPILKVAIPIFQKLKINLKNIETTGLDYIVYSAVDETLMAESLLTMLCAPVDSEKDSTYNMENPVWDMFIYVSDEYKPLVEDAVEDMDLPIELDSVTDTLQIPQTE